MLDASPSYKRAREILKRLLGQAHVIAGETLEDLFETEILITLNRSSYRT